MEAVVKIHSASGEQSISAAVGAKLSELLIGSHHSIDLPCGGRGICRNCRVRAAGRLSPPSEAETEALGADLQAGWRLACLTHVEGDCELWPSTGSFDTAVVDGIEAETAGDTLYHNYGLAVDIGTTTIAAKLFHSGQTIASAAAKNPQIAYGADVISRIGHSLDGDGPQLAALVREAVAKLAGELCESAGCNPDEIDAAVITGNTAMLYLLTGRSPASIAAAPFEADWLAGESLPAEALGLPLAPGAKIYLPRCMAAFVGGDITTAVLASGITSRSATALLVDIGTNGEIALWHEGVLTCCSTAAGPAFEGAGITCGMHGVAGAIDHVAAADGKAVCTVIGGGPAKGLCGSAVVDAVAVMRKLEVLDETGCIELDEDYFPLRDGVCFFGSDVRAVQLAKSAICSGIETLLEHAGLAPEQVETLYLAGGFGSFLDLDNAAAIGLFPQSLRSCARVVGNAALSGAAMLLGDRALLEPARELAQNARAADLGTSKLFFERYVDNMSL